jgi:hypothetical protein
MSQRMHSHLAELRIDPNDLPQPSEADGAIDVHRLPPI